jgi:uncharacterized membrane protein
VQLDAQDIAAALVAVIATVGLVVIGILGEKVPAELTGLLGLAAGWLFRGQAQNTIARRQNRT